MKMKQSSETSAYKLQTHRQVDVSTHLLAYEDETECSETSTYILQTHRQVDVSTHLLAYKDETECSEKSEYKLQTPGNYPKKAYNIRNTAKA